MRNKKEKRFNFTYILYCSETKLFKIGGTNSPLHRFSQLCSDTIQPIYLINKDLEGKLHKKYAKERTTHPGKYTEGKTEYFKHGGAFKKMADKLLTLPILPYITPHKLATLLDIDISHEAQLNLHLDNDKLYNFRIGYGILELLGLVPNSNKMTKNGRFYGHVFLFDGKVAISPKLTLRLQDFKFIVRLKHEIGERKGFKRSNVYENLYIAKKNIKN